MSTHYRALKTIRMSDVFDGRLARFNVREHQGDDTSPTHRCLTDGVNYLWVSCGEDGSMGCLTRHAPGGNPLPILECIAEAFSVDIASEYEPEFWGFDSQQEWEEYLDRMLGNGRRAEP